MSDSTKNTMIPDMPEKTDEPSALSGKLPGETGRRFNFEFIKSNSFRVIHVDGAWGGITHNFNIQMAVFSERNPIPQRLTIEVVSGDSTREVSDQRVMKDAIIREVEASLMMDFATAVAIHTWLGDKIRELEAIFKKQMEQENQQKEAK